MKSKDEFHEKISRKVEEACKLVELEFKYVTGEYTDEGKIFRKRKMIQGFLRKSSKLFFESLK